MAGAVLSWLIDPLHTSVCLLVLGSLVVWRWRRGARLGLGFGLIAIGLGWGLLWSLPVASEALRDSLVRRRPSLPLPQSSQPLQSRSSSLHPSQLHRPQLQSPQSHTPRADAIVLLGGAIGPVSRFDQGDADAPALAGNRVALAARVWREHRTASILLSGGPAARTRGVSEARIMAAALRKLGVPQQAMVLEDRSTSTGDNARNSAAIARQRGWHRVVLITSAMHLPRATRLFEREGLQVLPMSPPEPRVAIGPAWRPSLQAVRRSGETLKEYGLFLLSAA
ncbi:YdcF family protein [Lysobacter capsici]|uniref:YdcF family protein n=1 Tax=Lysobacter capsici TaxID=435897 RepID=UPI001C001897|nr:YdcF family protein [Lysobacter capsici]QWF19528.1 YdcF family protein [Lysobacter capsici]